MWPLSKIEEEEPFRGLELVHHCEGVVYYEVIGEMQIYDIPYYEEQVQGSFLLERGYAVAFRVPDYRSPPKFISEREK